MCVPVCMHALIHACLGVCMHMCACAEVKDNVGCCFSGTIHLISFRQRFLTGLGCPE